MSREVIDIGTVVFLIIMAFMLVTTPDPQKSAY